MRRQVVAAVFLAFIAGACSESSQPSMQPQTVAIPLVSTTAQQPEQPKNHRTHLNGDQEPLPTPPGPTPADSHGQGEAIFQIAKDGLSFDYKLIASNIENITQAHIHCGPAGMNGPIIVWLYPSPTARAPLPGGAGRHDGVLAEGTIESSNAAHVIARPSSVECPGGVATFDDVIEKILAANAYVNVHTNDGVAPTNTGPGDFPGGEIRGQLE